MGTKASSAEAAEQIATGALLAAFDFEEYRGTGQKKEDKPAPKKFDWTFISNDAKVRTGLDRAKAIADGQNFARTIASRPGNNINPPSLAKVAQEMAREMGLGGEEGEGQQGSGHERIAVPLFFHIADDADIPEPN